MGKKKVKEISDEEHINFWKKNNIDYNNLNDLPEYPGDAEVDSSKLPSLYFFILYFFILYFFILYFFILYFIIIHLLLKT